jgi:hypothetical protein
MNIVLHWLAVVKSIGNYKLYKGLTWQVWQPALKNPCAFSVETMGSKIFYTPKIYKSYSILCSSVRSHCMFLSYGHYAPLICTHSGIISG